MVTCKLCGREVGARDPERYPYCEGCHYAGAAEDDLRAPQLARFRAAFPGATVRCEHTGGGCFWLAFRWDGEEGFYVATAGEASLPEVGGEPLSEGGWGLVLYAPSAEASLDGDEVKLLDPAEAPDYWETYPEPSVSDEAVIEAIRRDRAARFEPWAAYVGVERAMFERGAAWLARFDRDQLEQVRIEAEAAGSDVEAVCSMLLGDKAIPDGWDLRETS